MIAPETKRLLSEITTTPHGRALVEYLETAFEELNDVRECKSWEETLGRQFAMEYLKDLFSILKSTGLDIGKKNKNPYV